MVELEVMARVWVEVFYDCRNIAPGSFGCGSGGGNSSSAGGADSAAFKVVAIYNACLYQQANNSRKALFQPRNFYL
jgi:hypothetical protein